MVLEELVRRGIARGEGLVVGDEVPEVRILFLADRRFERDRLLRDLDDLADFVGGDEHPLRDLLGGRLAAELLKESTRDADELVDGLDHVDRDADRPRLVRDRTCDRLADPPRRVRGELVALAIVELFDGPDETDVPLLDQVEEAHAAADVLLRDRHDEAKVRLGQVVSCIVALLDELVGKTAQRALLVRVELRELVEVLDEDVAQLRAEHDELAETLSAFSRPVDLRVLRQYPEREALGIAARSVDEGDSLVDEDLRLVADLFAVRLALQRVAQLEEPVRDALQLLAAFFVAERREQLLDLAGLGVRDRPNDVLLRDVALLAPARDETLGRLAVLRVDPALRRRRRGRRGFLFLSRAFHSSLSSASAACKTVCRSRRCMSSASSFAS